MGGFTTITLKDTSKENIAVQNKKLDEIGLRKNIRFYSEEDVKFEFDFYMQKKKDGTLTKWYGDPLSDPNIANQINSYDDFKRFWSPEYLGAVFVPYFGQLSFDCYFGRTSDRAMAMIGKYIVENTDQIDSVSGSWSTFLERASLSKKNFDLINETIKE